MRDFIIASLDIYVLHAAPDMPILVNFDNNNIPEKMNSFVVLVLSKAQLGQWQLEMTAEYHSRTDGVQE